MPELADCAYCRMNKHEKCIDKAHQDNRVCGCNHGK